MTSTKSRRLIYGLTASIAILLLANVIINPVAAQEEAEAVEGPGGVDLETQPYITFDREMVDPPAPKSPITTKVYLENIGEDDARNIKLMVGDIGDKYETETLYGESGYNEKVDFRFSNVENAELDGEKVLVYEGDLGSGEKVTITFDTTVLANQDKTLPVYLKWEDEDGEVYKTMMNQITYFILSAQALSGEGITGEGGYLGNLQRASDGGGWESPFWPAQKEAPDLKLPGFSGLLAVASVVGTGLLVRRRTG